MTDDWWDDPPLNLAVTEWDDPSPRREVPLEHREAGLAARRGGKIAVGLIAAVAVAGFLGSLIPTHTNPTNAHGSTLAVPAPLKTPQPTSLIPSASPPVAESPDPFFPENPPQPSEQSVLGVRATVIRVVDGDTIHASIDGVDETIRIIGLDSPESLRPGTPIECFAREASTAAEMLLVPGDAIVLQSDPTQDKRDRYDRLLAHVILANGDLFAERMIEGGWAIHYIYNGSPSIYADRLASAQARAMADQAGLWSPTTCNGNAHAATAAP